MSKTAIISVLDRSGSMMSSISDVIGGFNTLVEQQRDVEGECELTTVIFDNEIEFIHENTPLGEVKPLTSKTFYARGSTALNDALMQAINRAGAHFASLDEADRPDKIIVFVSTDGYENSSQEFRDRSLVAEKIAHQREVYSWEFIFTGADVSAEQEAGSLNIDVGNTLNYAKSAVGTRSLYAGVSEKMTQFRTGQVDTCCFTAEEKAEVEGHVDSEN